MKKKGGDLVVDVKKERRLVNDKKIFRQLKIKNTQFPHRPVLRILN